MEIALEGKRVLITGGTSGIGYAAVKKMAAKGARVCFCGRNPEQGKKVLREVEDDLGKAYFFPADISKPEDVRALFAFVEEKMGGLDIAINNAGVEGEPGLKLAELSNGTFEETLAINLKGVFYCMKEEIALMLPKGSGIIINMASSAGVKIGRLGIGVDYAVSKQGVIALTKKAAIDYGGEGLSVMAILPKSIDTPMRRRAWEKVKQRSQENIAHLEKPGTDPEKVVEVILALVSDQGQSMNGELINVNAQEDS